MLFCLGEKFDSEYADGHIFSVLAKKARGASFLAEH